jgi:hypothetical protein
MDDLRRSRACRVAGGKDDLMSMGSHFHFRSLQPGEDGVVRDLFARLSLPTRYLRFFLPLPVLSDSLLRIISGAEDQYGR